MEERKRNNPGVRQLIPDVEPVQSKSQCTSQLHPLVPVPSLCPPLPGQTRGLKEWSLWGKRHLIPAGIISLGACQISGFTKKNPKNRIFFFFSPKPHKSDAVRAASLEVFGDTANVPEDLQGRQLLLPDTSALSRSGPSCSPAPIYSGRGRKAFGSLEVSKGWAKPLSVSLLPLRSKVQRP